MQIDNEDDFSLLIAWMQYNFGENKSWNLRAGRQFVAMSREDWQFAPPDQVHERLPPSTHV